jgi:hypothetical protein
MMTNKIFGVDAGCVELPLLLPPHESKTEREATRTTNLKRVVTTLRCA